MKEIISIINQKGGVGKSATAHAIGAGLKLRGFNVLYIDLDPQGNLSFTLGANVNDSDVLRVLNKEIDAKKAIQRTPGGDIIPSSPDLAGADALITQVGKEFRLKEAIASLSDEYDYVIIDTPPALGILTVNALAASNSIIVPAQADVYSLQGISQLYNTISAVKQYCNPTLAVKGILLTRYNNRAVLSRDFAEMIAQTATSLNTIVFKSTIRENISIKEAQASQKDIFAYAPKSNASEDYQSLITEIFG